MQPNPPTVHPKHYGTAARTRATDIAEELDWLSVDGNMPTLADALSLQSGELVKLIDEAIGNEVGGTNVVPHLLSTLDAQLFELRVLHERLRR